jgi:GNAT superfamily N-acetyltransferase
MARFGDPEPLASHHVLHGFRSGAESLDRWLVAHARQSAAGNASRTYAMTDVEQERVVAFHSLAAAAVDHASATARARKGQPRHPVPAVLLARLAVDVSVRGRGLGALLLGDALLRVLSASERIGIGVVLVHALNPLARAFYEHAGFEPSPSDPLNLQLLVSDVRRTLG